MSTARKVVEVTPLQVALMGAIAAERDRRQKASGLDMADFLDTQEYQALAAVGRIVEGYLDTAPDAPTVNHEAEVRAAATHDTASELRANVRDLERKAADQRDQFVAAGCIIAALVRQLDSHGAVVPYLPNIPAAQQSAAMRMLAAVGLDCNGRRVA